MSRLLKDRWPKEPDTVTRHDLIHQLLIITIVPLDPMGLYGDAQKEIWERAEPSHTLVNYVRQPSAQTEFVALQKRLFRHISHLIEIRDMWTPVLPYLWLNRLERSVPDEWRLSGDDFAVLRGAYQQNFELSCQALPTLVVIQNAADGRAATSISIDDEASPWIPAGISSKMKPVRTLAQFKKLNAESKQAYLDRFPVTETMWLDRSKDSSHHIGQHPLSAAVCGEFPLVKRPMRDAVDHLGFGNTCLRVPADALHLRPWPAITHSGHVILTACAVAVSAPVLPSRPAIPPGLDPLRQPPRPAHASQHAVRV
jgi:hypothetical protein